MYQKGVISGVLPNQANAKPGYVVFAARQPLLNVQQSKRCKTSYLPLAPLTAFLILFALLLSDP